MGSCCIGIRYAIHCDSALFFFFLVFQEVVDTLDARIFLRVPYDVLKKRRSERSGYATAGRPHFLYSHSPPP